MIPPERDKITDVFVSLFETHRSAFNRSVTQAIFGVVMTWFLEKVPQAYMLFDNIVEFSFLWYTNSNKRV